MHRESICFAKSWWLVSSISSSFFLGYVGHDSCSINIHGGSCKIHLLVRIKGDWQTSRWKADGLYVNTREITSKYEICPAFPRVMDVSKVNKSKFPVFLALHERIQNAFRTRSNPHIPNYTGNNFGPIKLNYFNVYALFSSTQRPIVKTCCSSGG